MKAQIYKDSAGEWRWRLRADNGEPIADSAEGYVTERDCNKGLYLVLGATEADTTIETFRQT